MNNVWFESNKVKLEGIKRFLIQESYKTDSSPDALNPMYLNNMFDGAILEILRLQKEVNRLTEELNEMQKEPKSEKKTDGEILRLQKEVNRLTAEANTPQEVPKPEKTDG